MAGGIPQPTSTDLSGQHVSLRMLVNDLIGEANQGVKITSKFIGKAVEGTARNINKAFILDHLGQFLDQEVNAGHFVKIGDDDYLLPAMMAAQHIPTIQQLTVPIPPENLTEMMPTSSIMAAPPMPPRIMPAPCGKTDEERKTDLIMEKMTKMSNKDKDKDKSKSSGKKSSSGGTPTNSAPGTPVKEPIYVKLREKRLAEMKGKKKLQNQKAAAAATAAASPAEKEKKKGQGKNTPPATTSPKSAKLRGSAGKKTTTPLTTRRGKRGGKVSKTSSGKGGEEAEDTTEAVPDSSVTPKRKRKREEWKMTLQESQNLLNDVDANDKDGSGRPGSMRKKVRTFLDLKHFWLCKCILT